jgi:hypothetical protein
VRRFAAQNPLFTLGLTALGRSYKAEYDYAELMVEQREKRSSQPPPKPRMRRWHSPSITSTLRITIRSSYQHSCHGRNTSGGSQCLFSSAAQLERIVVGAKEWNFRTTPLDGLTQMTPRLRTEGLRTDYVCYVAHPSGLHPLDGGFDF